MAGYRRTTGHTRDDRADDLDTRSVRRPVSPGAFGNQALVQLLASGAPPQVLMLAHGHPVESAAHVMASALMQQSSRPGPKAPKRTTSGGLDPDTRAFFEPRFGADLGHVRVHTGSDAARSAARVGAAAYTVGSNIVVGEGQRPGPNLVTAH